MTSAVRLLCVCSILIGFAACDEIDEPFVEIDDDDDDNADENENLDDGLDRLVGRTTNLDNWWTRSLFAFTEPLTLDESPLDDAESAAQIVADNVDRYFAPAGCATVARDGSTLTYVLSECSGLLEPASIDGTLQASFSFNGDAIDFHVISRGLQVDGVPAALDVKGTFRASGDTRIVQYSAIPALTGFGETLSAEFDGTVTWAAGSNSPRMSP